VNEIERLLERGAVLLEPAGPMLPTEYGKRWLERIWTDLDRHSNTIRDVAKLAECERTEAGWESEAQRWAALEQLLTDEGVPTAISSGVSQYGMAKLIDHLNGKTAFTMPVTVAMALLTAAPTSTTTGATGVEATYTGYGRQTIAGAGWNAATAATPSVGTNASTITFGNCTAGTSTLLGFTLDDSATVSAGNALWYGTLTSTVISTTQTPPTVAAGALSTSMTGT
jgi:hypothetical protein